MENKRKHAVLGLGAALAISSLLGVAGQGIGALINKNATEQANQNAIAQQNAANRRQELINRQNELNNSVYKDRLESKLNVFSCGGRKRKVVGGKIIDNNLEKFIIGRNRYISKLKHKA
jgi:hypothetical protein